MISLTFIKSGESIILLRVDIVQFSKLDSFTLLDSILNHVCFRPFILLNVPMNLQEAIVCIAILVW